MRKIIALALCMILVCSALSVSAAELKLDDGGQRRNTGVSAVWGRTSGGTIGGSEAYIEVHCSITGQAFEDGYELVTANTWVYRTESPEDEVVEAYTTVVAWYNGDQTETAQGGCDNLVSGVYFPMEVRRDTRNTEKGTAGHSVTTEHCGDWICGTTVYARDWIWPYS